MKAKPSIIVEKQFDGVRRSLDLANELTSFVAASVKIVGRSFW